LQLQFSDGVKFQFSDGLHKVHLALNTHHFKIYFTIVWQMKKKIQCSHKQDIFNSICYSPVYQEYSGYW
jgi:hypothetical protein